MRYDNDENGVLSSDDTLVYSYSSSSKGIKQGTGTTTCGNGSLISSDDTIEITAMTLKLLTSSQTNGARALQLVVSGRFKATPALTLTLQRDIKLRNDGY